MIFKITYTPFHRTGNRPVRKGLELIGFKHVQVVKEQELPNPDFSTVAYLTSEKPATFTLA